jgi:hypothetical protein
MKQRLKINRPVGTIYEQFIFIFHLTQKYYVYDDQNALNSEDYYNLTGLTKEQFDELMTCVSYTDSMRASKTGTTKTCIALLLTELRCGLSNHLLATLFGMKTWQVCNVE